MSIKKINTAAFYGEYHGHTIAHLTTLYNGLVQVRGPSSPAHSFVWLCGDSSLDNKHWILNQKARACNGYEHILTDPNSAVPDVALQLNTVFAKMEAAPGCKRRLTAICCSVEESTVGARDKGFLLPQDMFLRDHVTPHDIVLVSAGGNDIALAPTVATVVNMGWLAKCSSTSNVREGNAWGLGHFKSLLGDDYEKWLNCLLGKQKPMFVVPSMIYFLDENQKAESWANTTLGLIGYNDNPTHVQAIISRVFQDCMVQRGIKIPGVRLVEPIELSKALDGKTTSMYVARVEPSASGGLRMAELYAKHITAALEKLDKAASSTAASTDAAGAPVSKAAAAAASKTPTNVQQD